MQGDDHSPDDAPLTIELRAGDGSIVVRRTTELGTYTRTIER